MKERKDFTGLGLLNQESAPVAKEVSKEKRLRQERPRYLSVVVLSLPLITNVSLTKWMAAECEIVLM